MHVAAIYRSAWGAQRPGRTMQGFRVLMYENGFALEILWMAESGYHVGASLQEHQHQNYYQLHYIVEGDGTFVIQGQPYPVRAHNLILVPPEVSHGIQPVQSDTAQIFRMLEVKFTVFDQELDAALKQIPIPAVSSAPKELLHQAFSESLQTDIYGKKAASCLFLAWIYQTLRQYGTIGRQTGERSDHIRLTNQIKEYLNTHLSEEISLDAVGQAIGYTKNYLCQVFRAQTGLTINTYLNLARVNQAAELLLHTNLELTEIATRCGYHSVHYFIKTFKKMLGVPPGSYRRKELTGVELVSGEVESVSATLRTPDMLLTHTGTKGQTQESS